jgi:hypothetical protein
LIDLETHRAVFTWVLQCLSTAGSVKGKTIGVDATTLEANVAMRNIVRRDSGESNRYNCSRRGPRSWGFNSSNRKAPDPVVRHYETAGQAA